MSEPSARIIADSINEQEDRVTTIEAVMHRYVLAEFNTHRMFSRNSASSRAIPLTKQLDRVGNDPAAPVVYPAEQKGMQGGDEIEEPQRAHRVWLAARVHAVDAAQALGDLGVHKSVANRLLEPFMWHTVVVTATEWDGFWKQRCSPLAQPEIRVVAEAMKAAYDASTPELLREGQWHLPYIDDETANECRLEENGDYLLAQISAARCARVSYLTQGGMREPDEDMLLYRRLVSADPMHASPLEHPCTPRISNVTRATVRQTDGNRYQIDRPRYGNFIGWHQLRYDVDPG